MLRSFCANARPPGEFRFVQIPAGRDGILCKTPGVARGGCSRLELSFALGIKAAEALPGIIGGIGWVSQNLWALVVGIGGLIYTYMGCTAPQALQGPMVTRK